MNEDMLRHRQTIINEVNGLALGMKSTPLLDELKRRRRIREIKRCRTLLKKYPSIAVRLYLIYEIKYNKIRSATNEALCRIQRCWDILIYGDDYDE